MTAGRLSAFAMIAAIALTLAGCAAHTPSASAAGPVADAIAPVAATDPTVVMIGDSIMKGNGLSASQAWPALMAQQNDWRLDNLACNGAGFIAVGSDSDCAETFAGLVAKAVALHPRTVIIQGSSNDFGQNDEDLLPETRKQLAQLRAALPHVQIIGLSTLWGDTAVPAQLADVDQQVRDAVTSVGGTFLTIGQPLSGHPEWMQRDDVHPTAAGQQAIYRAVRSAFGESHVRA